MSDEEDEAAYKDDGPLESSRTEPVLSEEMRQD